MTKISYQGQDSITIASYENDVILMVPYYSNFH